MNTYEMRLRVQNTVQQTVENILAQGVSATLVEDALYKALAGVKDLSQQEFIISISTPPTQEEEEEKVEE